MIRDSDNQAYLRLKIGKDLKNRFKASCVLANESMTEVAVHLIERWIEEDAYIRREIDALNLLKEEKAKRKEKP